MFCHIIELKAKPGKAPDICSAIRDHTVPEVVERFQGFRHEIVLVGDDDPDHVTAISMWDSKASADAFYQSGFEQVSAMLVQFLEAKPERRDCDVAVWTGPAARQR